MKKINQKAVFILIFPVFILFGFTACQDKKTSEKDKVGAINNDISEKSISEWPAPDYYTSGIPVYEKFDALEPVLRMENDSTYVINFWATWCKPCIKELPYFKELDSIYKDEKVKVVLVSLDFPKDVEIKLVSFAREKQIESQVVVLLDGTYNDWVDKVSPEWSGAIPATYIYNRERNKLFQKSFENTEEIIDAVDAFL